MSEMIERVARALIAAIDDCTYVGISDNLNTTVTVDGEVSFLAVAIAAIEAMREPTDEMIYAAVGNGQQYDDVWRAMIDAALVEKVPA